MAEARRAQEDIQRRNLERYYAKLPPGDLIGELHRYCPTGEPPCAYAPPDALVQEAARRGLIIFNNDVPSRNPIGTTPGLTSRTAPQVDFGKDDPVAHLPRDGRMSGLPGGLKCADLLNNGREVCFFTITIGKIGIDTVEGVKKLLDYKHRSSRLIGGSVVFLNSPGGDVYPAMEIGRILRKEKAAYMD